MLLMKNLKSGISVDDIVVYSQQEKMGNRFGGLYSVFTQAKSNYSWSRQIVYLRSSNSVH